MTFGDAVVSAFTKYAVFTGRARRAEFWYFHLFNLIVTVCMMLFVSMFAPEDAASGIAALYWLATFIPTLSLIWRRLQDTGRSGFLFFLVFVPVVGAVLTIIWLCMDGDRGPNRFGPDPKGRQ